MFAKTLSRNIDLDFQKSPGYFDLLYIHTNLQFIVSIGIQISFNLLGTYFKKHNHYWNNILSMLKENLNLIEKPNFRFRFLFYLKMRKCFK